MAKPILVDFYKNETGTNCSLKILDDLVVMASGRAGLSLREVLVFNDFYTGGRAAARQ